MQNLTIVIPYRNQRAALNRLLESLPADVPVIVVDDQSETPPDDWEDARVIRPTTRGYFAGACNAGINACDTDVLILNQDIWFDKGYSWLAQLDEWRAKYAAIGQGVAGHPAWPKGYIDGRFMFMRRDAIKAIGGFNMHDWPLWGGTCEWQARACRKGFKALPLPDLDWYSHEERHKSKFGASITEALKQEPGKRGQFIRTPPLISVIIPCYNYGRFLADAVHSLIGGKTCLGKMPGQTFGGFEVIIVDDASTDNSVKLAEALCDPWQGVRLVKRGKNGGTAACLNTGCGAAYGRYLQVLSADDMLAPEALETLYRVLEANPERIAYSDQYLFDGKKKTHIWEMKDYDFDELLLKNHVPAGILMPKEGWVKAGGYPEEFRGGREDWALAVGLGRVGYCGIHVPQPLYWYRRDGHNRSLTNSSPVHRQMFADQIKARYPDLYGGARPVGCCGGGRRAPAGGGVKHANRMAAAPKIVLGQEGMTLIEYIGKNVGRTYWYGPVTRAQYSFTGSQRVKYVDNRDVAGMLKLLYDRAPAFRRYVVPEVPKVPEPEAEPEPTPVVEVEPERPDPLLTVEPEGAVKPAPVVVAEAVVESPVVEATTIVAVEQAGPRRRRSRKDTDNA